LILCAAQHGEEETVDTYRKMIINRLQNLEWIDGVTVQATNGKKSVTVTYTREKALDFKFQWAKDHFIGYFVDSNRSKSQAVLSLRTPMDAALCVNMNETPPLW